MLQYLICDHERKSLISKESSASIDDYNSHQTPDEVVAWRTRRTSGLVALIYLLHGFTAWETHGLSLLASSFQIEICFYMAIFNLELHTT